LALTFKQLDAFRAVMLTGTTTEAAKMLNCDQAVRSGAESRGVAHVADTSDHYGRREGIYVACQPAIRIAMTCEFMP